MSSTFPPVPGYDGPFSLKDFLHLYLGLHLHWTSSRETSGGPTPSETDAVVVPPTGHFHVVTYVSRSAPPKQRFNRSVGGATVGTVPTEGHRQVAPTLVQLQGRPLTSSVLGHPFWDSLFSQIGVEAVGLIALWVPIIVQFEPSGGGLQVLGPPLMRSVPRAMKRQLGGCWWEGKAKAPRTEAVTPGNSHCLSIEGTSFPSLLYRQNVPRLQLAEELPVHNTTDNYPVVASTLARLWTEHHKLERSSTSTESSRRRLCCVTSGSATSCCSADCVVLLEAGKLVSSVFSYTLSPVHDKAVGSCRALREYLVHVLHCVLGSVCRMNVRGAAIRHTDFLEKRCRSDSACCQQRRACEAGSEQKGAMVSELTVPEPIVASYLRTLFEAMWWRPPTCHAGGMAATRRERFWGEERIVLTKLFETTVDWLSCGRHEVFLLSHFLHGVPVAGIPWLRGFYTKGLGRKRRSMIQQRVFLQLILFLYRYVVPFLVRRSFYVAYASKGPQMLQFIPRAVWARITYREMRKVCARRTKRTRSDVPSELQTQKTAQLLPMALERVTSEGLLRFVGSLPRSTCNGGDDKGRLCGGSTPLLYSDVRFLIDGCKLRPIARPRFGWAQSLLRAADGIKPSTSTSATRRAGRSSATGVCGAMWSSPNSSILRDALRCLNAGIEEQRISTGIRQQVTVSHNDEYIEVRSFIQCARQFCALPALAQGDEPVTPLKCTPSVIMVRGDAARCYDYLPQQAVVDIARGLVAHDIYYSLKLTVITPSPARDTCGNAAKSESSTCLSDKSPGSIAKHHRLQVSRRVRVVPERCIREGILYGIAQGSIAYEEPSTGPDCVLDGEEIRSVLQRHLQSHLVRLNGKTYIQHVGINQGSSVAMLLCDQLLKTVDDAISNILSEHEEPALLLRRVDDVLVVTLSRAAASRCEEALRNGWPGAGFFCHGEKLKKIERGQCVRWCGLLWDPETLEFSVDWTRLAKMMPYLAVRPRTGREPLFASTRFIRILRLRTPMTALCRHINGKARVVQTLYEIGLLWSRFFLDKVKANAAFIRPHVRTILQPLAFATATLRRLVRQHSWNLQRLGSFCDVSDTEVQFCICTALYRTLRYRLSFMIDKMAGMGKRKFLIVVLTLLQRKMEKLGRVIGETQQVEFSLPTAPDLLRVEGDVNSKGFAAVRFTST